MNIAIIIIKEIKQTLRDKRSMAMMILFPILLIAVLGAALKSGFNNNIGKAEVLYSITSNSEAARSFKTNIIEKGKEYNINFKKTKDIEKSKEELGKITKYDSLIVMSDDNKIKIYRSSDSGLLSGLSSTIVRSFAQEYNTIANIAKENPAKLKQVLTSGDGDSEYTKITSIGALKTPTSLGYYAVTMTTLIIMYGAVYGLLGITSERQERTQNRILAAPIRKYEFLAGKMLGIMLSIMLQIIIEFLVTKYIMGVYWGNAIPLVLLVLFSQIVMVVSLGISLGFVFKNQNAARSVIDVGTPIMVFLAGGYIQVDNMGGQIFQTIRNISPVNWTNKAIFGTVYGGDTSKVLPAVFINMAIAAVLIIISSIMFRKEAA
ncbi:ABC transporter permease [Clostridium oryzae]|uniref:Inner membrane transport permease YbhS n=1 Tax=Clostridium oryzae TaxID=1450648 RepID=A0A1V4IR06_9CLOT|nr:ABC transporter permease [Clostridium oryzae]OPJ62240.1 inner membrane transport permease YbhS [Clostridium oryzae]